MRLSDRNVAAFAVLSSFGGITAAAACCVLPLALAGLGVGAGGLAALGPLHTPLSAIAVVAVAAGWFLYLRRRRACTTAVECPPPFTATLVLLVVALKLVALSAVWPLIEAPLLRSLGG